MSEHGWIGVDLDGTLAYYERWPGNDTIIGAPVKPMVDRVKIWLDKGLDVRIFTARAFALYTGDPLPHVIKAIDEWCVKHIGTAMQITNCKDSLMIELWDDRCIAVEPNTGRVMGASREGRL